MYSKYTHRRKEKSRSPDEYRVSGFICIIPTRCRELQLNAFCL